MPRPGRPFLILGLLVAAVTAACGSGAGPSEAGRAVDAPGTPNAPQLEVSPNDGASYVTLNSVVTVRAAGGLLDSVAVHPLNNPAGLAGQMATDSLSWHSTAGLDPGVTYVVDATAHSRGGDASLHSTFSTIKLVNRLTTSTTPAEGDVVGVAMPITLSFNTPIAADRQSALVQHVQITSTPPVDGAWHWFSPTEVHWRPRDLWPVNMKVTVNGNLHGFDAGNDYYGLGDWTIHFSIAPDKHYSVIDAGTHQMQVFNNDQLLYTWPISAGRPKNPTLEGTLVVLFKQQDVLMDSQTIGIPRYSPDGYYEHVFWNTAISSDGFFVHSAPWSVWAQGSQNVSHGCVNLSPDRAITFFKFSQPGDVVVVRNTGRPADASDGEGDWQIPFDKFANSGQGATTPSASAQAGGGL